MASSPDLSERNTVKRLKHLGKKLLKHLPSADNLLELLDKLELVLSSIDQEPTKLIQEALVPSMKALISNELLRHIDETVKISVTSCITEITRITAPEVPYDDDQMKEIFKLMVGALEKLSHTSAPCYEKLLTMLDNVAKIRLSLVMLDLECDDLIIQMFHHFLRFIRSNHPHNSIESMESIMILVLNESEEISSDLLRPLLDCLRNENQTISPVSWTSAEKVMTNCAVKLKPYLMKAVESSGRGLNEYAQIVTSICKTGSESPQHDRSNGSMKTMVQEVENKLEMPKDADEQPTDATMGLERDVTCERDTQNVDGTKSNINASASAMDGEATKKSGSKRKPRSRITKNSKGSSAKTNLESVQEPESETQLNTPRKRDRKPNTLLNAEEGYDHWIYLERKTRKSDLSRKARKSSSAFQPSEKSTSRKDKLNPKPKTVSEAPFSEQRSGSIAEPSQSQRTCDTGSDFQPCENPASSKENVLSKPEDTSKGCEASASRPKTDENIDAASALENDKIPDGSHTNRGQPRKRKNNRNEDVHLNSVSILKEDNLNPLLKEISLDSPGVRLEKESEARKDSEVKPIRKIKFSFKFDGKTVVAPESVVSKEPKVSCGDEEKRKLAMNAELENVQEGRSSAQPEVKKRRKLSATPNKDLNKSSTEKDPVTESTSKTSSGVKKTPQAKMRKRNVSLSMEASETHELGNRLVGSKIKVWWPIDRTFYEGVVDSYDPIKGKHKILYTDGDVEVLNLKKQRWEPIAFDVSLDKEDGLALHKLAEASDIAEKSKEKSEVQSSKGENKKSRSRVRASSNISKSGFVKKSMDTSAVERSALADESIADLPKTVGGQDSDRKKPKTKRMKTGSDTKKNKPDTDDLVKEKTKMA
ncbi:hypothetical protein RJT34_16896 [Clitoria ternatea]|uniref:Uncharacterized protein n=1 Tax=Clitoria ternatea TaxID=43366 RepID=A0AAN9JA26_CLITE